MLDMFKDPSGKTSMQRVLLFMVVTAVMAVWLWISLSTKQFASFDIEQAILILGLFGMKTGQSFGEKYLPTKG